MRKNDYQPLGKYIEQVNVRNRDLTVTNLMGVSIEKRFIPSIANTIGTDLSPYKIVKPGQFAYGPVTSRNGDKITIALYNGNEDCIISQAYEAFRIKDTTQLLPEYLMMWAKRPEFDRYARYMSHGSVRELFSWEEMCNVMLPVPPIEEQRRIVSEYQTVEHRIANNEALIQKLEETAQAIYHHTFVEGIDEENLPEGWNVKELGEICEYNTANLRSINKYAQIRYFDTSSLTNNKFEECTIINSNEEIPSRARRLVQEGDILYSTVRPNLCHYGIIRDVTENTVVSTGFIVLRSIIPYVPNEYLFLNVTRDDVIANLQDIAEQGKSTYPSITDEDLMKLDIIIPPVEYFETGEGRVFSCIYYYVANIHKENSHLRTLLSLLTSKLS